MSFDGKCFCVVTGSSAGFGQAIAQLLTKENGLLHNASLGSKVLLLSRKSSGLEETKSLIIKNGHVMERFTIDILSVDLSDMNDTESQIKHYISNLSKDFTNVIIFNNAGSVGDISKTILQYDSNILDIQKYFNLNITSSIFIISSFCKYLVQSRKVIVQTSTLCALQPFPYMNFYCTGKAGMDMFMKCLTLDHPDIITLSYAPGPLKTKMGIEMKDLNGSEEIRKSFTEMFENGSIIKPVDSAAKLLNLLKKMEFKSGSHIDFYDI